MAYIQYDPNKPGDRARACGRLFLSMIAVYGSLGAIIYYIYSIIPCFRGDLTEGVLGALGWVVGMAFFNFFFFTTGQNKSSKVRSAKFCVLYFSGGLVGGTGIIALVVSALSIYRDGTGIGLLLASLTVVAVSLLAVFVGGRKLNGRPPIRLFTDKKQKSAKPKMEGMLCPNLRGESVREDVIYCRHCGARLPSDSVFCSSCGIKL